MDPDLAQLLAQLRRLGGRYQHLRTELAQLRPALADAIRAAHAAGVRQVDIVRATGYTRDMVRLVCGSDGQGPVRAEAQRGRGRR